MEARLRRPVFVSAADADLSVEGRVERSAPGFRATVEVRRSDGALLGTREIVDASTDCHGLAETLPLVIALMIDPEGARAEPVVSSEGNVAPPPRSIPAP